VERKTPSEPEPGRAAICLDQLGVEWTGKRGQLPATTPILGMLNRTLQNQSWIEKARRCHLVQVELWAGHG